MIYLITYDLKKPGRDYNTLYDTIKTAPSWWHYLESTWIIYTQEPIKDWSDRIRKVIDENDLFLIVEITKQKRQGWLQHKAWEWLREKENQ